MNICSAVNGAPEGFICGVDQVCRGEVCQGESCDDFDGDQVCDEDDNCVVEANTDQTDEDTDGRGDVCDECPNDPTNDSPDRDLVCNNVDVCPLEFDPSQADSDQDGAGDACTPIDYAALGDSYSSGEGVLPYFSPTSSPANSCHRSANAYSNLILDPSSGRLLTSPQSTTGLPQYRPFGEFLACSGAATEDIRSLEDGGKAQKDNETPPDDDIPARFERNLVCSTTGPSWIFGLSIPRLFGDNPDRVASRSFHPTERGQQEYASRLNAFIASKIASGSPLNRAGLPVNPSPQAQPFSSATAPATVGALPEFGDLEVEAVLSAPIVVSGDITEDTVFSGGLPACAAERDVYGRGQVVALVGEGFATSTPVTVRFEQPGTPAASLPTAAADAAGRLQTEVVIPGTALPDAPGVFLAEGAAPSGAHRVLISTPVAVALSITGDPDRDGVIEVCENCSAVANANQLDSDLDGIGDACDPCPLDPENDFDGDGLCAAEDPDPFVSQLPCSDGFDNDEDGFTDFPNDPGCGNASSSREDPQCSDGIDNDGDGFVDAGDPQCSSPADNREGITRCGLLGIEPVLLLTWIWRKRRQLRTANARA